MYIYFGFWMIVWRNKFSKLLSLVFQACLSEKLSPAKPYSASEKNRQYVVINIINNVVK